MGVRNPSWTALPRVYWLASTTSAIAACIATSTSTERTKSASASKWIAAAARVTALLTHSFLNHLLKRIGRRLLLLIIVAATAIRIVGPRRLIVRG